MEDNKNVIKQAIEYHKTGNYAAAEPLYLEFLSKNPLEAKAYHLLGAMYLQNKDFKKANATLLKAFELENSLPVQTDLALSYYELNDYNSAFFHLKNVLNAEKNKVLLDKIIECAQKSGFLRDALKYLIMQYDFFGGDIFKLREIAALAQDLDEFAAAEIYLKKIIETCPNDHIAYNNLGLVYEFVSDFNGANVCYRKALEINPTAEAAYNLSVLLKRERKFTESLDMLHFARNLGYKNEKCDYAEATLKLLQRDFSGYEGYSRYLRQKQKDILTIWWDGRTKDKNATLVICATEGFGDVLMFARYLDFINPEDFKEVILIVPESLYELFCFNFPGFKVVKMGTTLAYTFGMTLIDLPYTLGLDFEHIPSSEKYLMAPAEYSAKWQALGQFSGKNQDKKLKVGLFFFGNRQEKRTLYNRNLPLQYLKTLTDIENAEFYSLQPEKMFKEDLKTLGITDLSDKIGDFSDTASIIENLDLVISTDSSVLHLAGALGKKTYLLLPYSGDWRWFSDTEKTPWYDSVEIIRQEVEGDWNPVIERVRAKISDTANAL